MKHQASSKENQGKIIKVSSRVVPGSSFEQERGRQQSCKQNESEDESKGKCQGQEDCERHRRKRRKRKNNSAMRWRGEDTKLS